MTLDELPGICGRGSSIDLNDVTVTNIDAFFGQGRLQLNVSFEKSDTCYDASGTMVTYVLLAVSGGDLIATAQPQTPNIKIDVSFWCELLPLAVLGPVGDLFTTWMEDILVDVAANAAVSIVSTMTGSSLSAPPTPGVQLTGVTITPNELSSAAASRHTNRRRRHLNCSWNLCERVSSCPSRNLTYGPPSCGAKTR